MKSLRALLATLVASCLLAASASAAVEWQTDFRAALAQASKENKLVLLDFTGSDWCPACMIMDRDVFSTPEFADYASKHLVLVKLDFTPYSQARTTQFAREHEALEERFGIEGFPTFVILDPKGKELARTIGYLPGGPTAFIKWVESVAKT